MAKPDVRLDNIRMLLQLKKLQDDVIDCEGSLRKFVRSAWEVVEPGIPYVHGRHIEALCDHLEAVAAGEIRKLIINISPRSSKSTLGCIMFPAWVWITRPERKFLFSSYDLKLSMRDSRKCNMLIKSAWYQKNWHDRFKILTNKGGQDTKQRFDNDRSGHRVATSTDSGTTGEGGWCIYYDDPNDIRQMSSDAYIQTVIDFHEQVMASRLDDPKTGVRVCVQQRSNERDLTGHILNKELGWEHLVIPMEYEGPSKTTVAMNWRDWRTSPGDLMWPERIGPNELRDLKTQLGSAAYAGQYQQRPAPAEGNKFKRIWWEYWNPATVAPRLIRISSPGNQPIERTPVTLPIAFEQVIHSWDFSFKGEKDSDYVVGQAWGRLGANFYLLDQVRRRMDFPATIKAFKEFVVKNPAQEKLIEDKANGPAIVASLRNQIPGIIAITPDGGKEARANAIAPYVESRNVFLPNPEEYPWVVDFIEEFSSFPFGKTDDQCDSAAQAIRRLADSISNTSVPEFRVTPRPNEKENACHVQDDKELAASIPAHWRRWIAVAPGPIGAATWFCETPTGSLRIYRELALEGMGAFEVGRRIGEATLPDIRAFMKSVHLTAKWNMDLLMEDEAFRPIEPIGSYAELLEQGLYNYDPTSGSWEDRQGAKSELALAKFSFQMSSVDDAAFDRLRELLCFQPPDYEELPYERAKAIKYSLGDIREYTKYMAAVRGEVVGEWPKIKLGASCANTISALGCARREETVDNPFLRSLLLGLQAPPSLMAKNTELKIMPVADLKRRQQMHGARRRRFG